MQRVYLLIVFSTLLSHKDYLELKPKMVESDGIAGYIRNQVLVRLHEERDEIRKEKEREEERDRERIYSNFS